MSFAAGVLSAALALPPQGLIAAYDFARTNFLNWSEDLTQTTWSLTAAWATGTTRTISGGVTTIAVTGAGDGFIWTGINLTGNTTGLRIFMRARVRGSGSIRLNLADIGGAVPANDLANSNSVTLTDQWQELYVTGVITPADRTGVQFRIRGAGPLRLEVERAQGGYGADAPYEKTTDGQLLLDRSVRLWPAPAARTNLLNWTEDFQNSAWVKNAVSVTDPVVTEPTTGAKAWRLTAATSDPFILQSYPTNPSGLTVTYRVWIKAEGGSIGKSACFYSYGGNSSPEQVVTSPYVALTGAWQLMTWTRTFPAGMTSTIMTWRVDMEQGVVAGDAYLLAAPIMNFGPAALPYERQTDGVTYDFSLKGRNLLPNSDLTGTAGSAPTGWFNGPVTAIGYGTDGSVTFTATARYGAISVPSATLPLGGRPFTASVEFTQATPTVYLMLYLYDSAGTYIGQTTIASAPGRTFVRVNRTDVYRAEFRIEDGRTSGWTPVTFRQPMLELGLTDGGYQASARHTTLGSSAASADSNDPAWTAQGLSFDGVDDFAQAIWPTDYSGLTVIAVGKYAAGASGQNNTIASQWTSPSGWLMQPLTSNALTARFLVRAGGNIASASGSTPFTDQTKAFMHVGRYNGQKAQAWYYGLEGPGNGVPVSGGISGTSVGYLGRESSALISFKGDLYYFLIYNRALAEAEISQVHRFIRNQLSRRGVTI